MARAFQKTKRQTAPSALGVTGDLKLVLVLFDLEGVSEGAIQFLNGNSYGALKNKPDNLYFFSISSFLGGALAASRTGCLNHHAVNIVVIGSTRRPPTSHNLPIITHLTTSIR